tara:strand:+ start:98 stop:280 length:183 start_codon:yes stop_codon:yes gene_type:complete
MSIKLKPCPFCGGEAEIQYCEEGCCGALPRSIECECGCYLGLEAFPTEESAIQAWNRRVK